MAPTKITRPAAILAATVFLLPLTAGADWLVTSSGDTVETQGPWKVKGRMLVFTDTQGALRSMRLSEIDLEASQAATAKAEAANAKAEAAKTEAQAAKAPAKKAERKTVMVLTNADIPRGELDRPAAELTPQPAVTMYSTSWCGYCRKAGRLLGELGVSYVEKDIEKDATAKREHAAIARGRGVPVLDIGGTVVRGFSPEAIRKAVAQLPSPTEPSKPADP
ncbi:MAG: glutaredoxin domain-containing protein [Acidobacteriota bacterium]